MVKKGKEKGKKPKAPKHQKKEVENREGTNNQPDGFDFGGLPPRNLKKNLGC